MPSRGGNGPKKTNTTRSILLLITNVLERFCVAMIILLIYFLYIKWVGVMELFFYYHFLGGCTAVVIICVEWYKWWYNPSSSTNENHEMEVARCPTVKQPSQLTPQSLELHNLPSPLSEERLCSPYTPLASKNINVEESVINPSEIYSLLSASPGTPIHIDSTSSLQERMDKQLSPGNLSSDIMPLSSQYKILSRNSKSSSPIVRAAIMQGWMMGLTDSPTSDCESPKRKSLLNVETLSPVLSRRSSADDFADCLPRTRPRTISNEDSVLKNFGNPTTPSERGSPLFQYRHKANPDEVEKFMNYSLN